MAVRIVQTTAPAETESLGAELAAVLEAGDLVLVSGELGAGKTTLVRGAARALGVRGPVTSPSFSIGHRYAGDGVVVSHLDLYRLAGLEHEEADLLADYTGPGRIAFVEWPARRADEPGEARPRRAMGHARGPRPRVEGARGRSPPASAPRRPPP